jgi:hypothetical protein
MVCLTVAERAILDAAAVRKTSTWARETLLEFAKGILKSRKKR